MKIGIITEYFYPTLGGITENVYHFSKEILRLGHDFRIVTGWINKTPDIDQEVANRVIYVGRSIPVFFNGSQGRITLSSDMSAKVRDLFAKERFDVMHIHSPIFPTLAMIANMQANTPIVATFHTCLNGGGIYYRIFKSGIQKLLDRMSVRVAVSKACAEENEFYTDRKFEVIPNGIDVSWWERKQEKKDDITRIVFMGRADTRNGLNKLIEAFKIVHQKCPKTELLIIGDGPLMFMLKKMALGMENSIKFLGAATDKRPDLVTQGDVFVFAPLVASFGITLLEGMASKKAIVASDIPAFRELLQHKKSALLVNPNRTEEIASAIESLIQNPDRRLSLSEEAFKKVGEYNWHNVTKKYIECYENALFENDKIYR